MEGAGVIENISIHLQRLVEKLTEIIQNRHVANRQRRARGTRRRQRGIIFICSKGNHWDMRGGTTFFHARNGFTDLRLMRFDVSQHHERFIAFGLFDEASRTGNWLHAIPRVLEPVHQLTAGKQSFIEEQCERLRHLPNIGRALLKLQTNSAIARNIACRAVLQLRLDLNAKQ
jgi:hypothetical protein